MRHDLPRTHLRGEIRHLALTRHEYHALYYRAVTATRKEAATVRGISDTSERHALASAFKKLQVTSILEAFREMGWLKPVTWQDFSERETDAVEDPRPFVPWGTEEEERPPPIDGSDR